MSRSDRTDRRIEELDALRGAAAFGVLIYHYTVHYDFMHGLIQPFTWTFEAGKYGVHLFFVISGFVIFMTLQRTQHAMDFVVSRFSRLFPAYWVAMFITLAFVAVAGLPGQEVSRRDVLVNLTMITDFLNAKEIDGSYWTLQIELFFYAQMFFWYLIGGLDRIKFVIIFWLLLAAVYGIEARLGVSLSYKVRELLIVRYVPFFATGIILFRAWDREDPIWHTVSLLAGAALAAWLVWTWMEALVVVVCVAIFWLLILRRLTFLARRPFVYLGTISYTVYLLHQNIGFILIANLERRDVPASLSVAVTTVVILIMATVLTKLVERPAMFAIRRGYRRLRESFVHEKRAA